MDIYLEKEVVADYTVDTADLWQNRDVALAVLGLAVVVAYFYSHQDQLDTFVHHQVLHIHPFKLKKQFIYTQFLHT